MYLHDEVLLRLANNFITPPPHFSPHNIGVGIMLIW